MCYGRRNIDDFWDLGYYNKKKKTFKKQLKAFKFPSRVDGAKIEGKESRKNLIYPSVSRYNSKTLLYDR